ncbi:ecdysone oxidase-like [Anticarsia gemmatalis]|uniref:ecdysone oxidase-like n=1 Tax=Anticarsia gemmatalis TaxID=129554 RepID=UPI003F769F6D
MDSAAVAGVVQMMQSAFKLLALMQFTAYLWPHQAIVNNRDSFDFIIVGAGTAGSVIANRLTENPAVNVLLIEAGGDPPLESDLPGALLFLQKSQYDWNYTAEHNPISEKCHKHPYLEITQGKMLGGTSSLNYFQYARGYPVDFDSWAEITRDDTWKWENVLPYYTKSEKCESNPILNSADKKYHGTDGYLKVTEVNNGDVSEHLKSFNELGHDIVVDHNPEHPLGFSKLLVTISDGQRQSSATAFLAPIKERPNLKVLKETTVNKIIIKDDKATGVEAVTKEGKNVVFNAKKEVIVSAGTFNTPKLLMLSGIGPEEHLISKGIKPVINLPVGENLQDHLAVLLVHKLNKINSPPYPINPRLFPAISFRGFVALDKQQEYPDYELGNFVIYDDIVFFFCSFSYGYKHEICDTINKKIRGKMIVFNQLINVAPNSRGKLLLRSTNPADAPIILTEQYSDSHDIDNLVKFIADLNPVLNTTYYKEIDAEFIDPIYSSCKEFEGDRKEYWRCYVKRMSHSLNHFTSTCPMGTVVNGRLKVHGVKGLRVADASVMPTITRANPAATVVLIGEKTADFIKQEHKL